LTVVRDRRSRQSLDLHRCHSLQGDALQQSAHNRIGNYYLCL
jgi:hypothetical protein